MSTLNFEHADPWTGQLVDVPSLNASVSDKIVEVVDGMRRLARESPSELRSRSILVLGTAGAGKTHLFARLRRRCHQRAVFVLVRPGLGTGVTPRELLAHIVDALQRTVPSDERDRKQLDVLVGALVESVEQEQTKTPGRGGHFPLSTLVMLESDPERESRIEHVLGTLEQRHDDLYFDYLERLFAAPFLEQRRRRATIDFLAGRTPDETKLALLGVTAGLADNDVLRAIRSLAISAAHGAPIVLVFDQLENLIDDSGGSRILTYASLLSELVDTVPGLVLVQLALTDEWKQRFYPKLSQAHRTRLEREVFSLDLPAPDHRDRLLTEWRSIAGLEDRPTPHPFSDISWAQWRTMPGVTPRMLFIEFKRRLEGNIGDGEDNLVVEGGPESTRVDSLDENESLLPQLEQQWEAHLKDALTELVEAGKSDTPIDSGRVKSGLATLLDLRGDLEARADVPPSADLVAHRGSSRVTFKVIQESNGRSVASSVQKAKTLTVHERVVVLREKRLPIKTTWATTLGARQEFIDAGGRWHHLDHASTARLLALRSFLTGGQSGDITDARGRPVAVARVKDWLTRQVHEDVWSEMIDALFGPQSIDPITPPPSVVLQPPSSPSSTQLGHETSLPEPGAIRKGQLDLDVSLTSPTPTSSSITENPSTVHRAATALAPGGTTGLDSVEPSPTTERSGGDTDERDPRIDPLVLATIERLQLASLERVVREARRKDAGLSAEQVRSSLLQQGTAVRWLGRNIVVTGGLS